MADRNDPAAAGFLVEDFINSITTQLDRVQDALRIKAVNRPLTYALKELHLELKVFVEMDANGQVMLRASGPNEAGASTLAMDFTTITKPMIEENTISLAATRSTPLDNLGLKPEERMRLERLGVSNLAQLDRLRGSTGVSTVARMADVPVDRLRRALQAGHPRLGGVAPGPAPSTPATRPPAASPVRPPHAWPAPAQPPRMPPPRQAPPRPFTPAVSPPLRPAPGPGLPGLGGRQRLLRPQGEMAQDLAPDAEAQAFAAPGAGDALDAPPPVIALPPGSRRLTLSGSHLQHEAYPPSVRLNGQALEIEELDEDRLVVRLPEAFEPGALEVRLGDLPAYSFTLLHPAAEPAQEDPWAPQDAGSGGHHEA